MKMAGDFGRRFEQLTKQAEEIESRKKAERSEFTGQGFSVDSDDLLNLTVKVRHLLETVCGSDSHHFKLFIKSGKCGMYKTSYEVFRTQMAI